METHHDRVVAGPPAWFEWGGVRWYRNRSGYYQDRTGTLMHTALWERRNGHRVPDGHVVHHIDEDKSNNLPENLQLLTQGEHARLHLATRQEGNPWVDAQTSEKARERVTRLWEKRQARDVVCVGCGKLYQSVGMRAKYCTRTCASRHARSVRRAGWAG
jgi:hypothetical protein